MKPTLKQLAYLRSLANRTGQTFTYPHTAASASAEIRRLKGVAPDSRCDRARERRAIERDMAERRDDATAVRAADTRGWGSTARWAHTPDDGSRS